MDINIVNHIIDILEEKEENDESFTKDELLNNTINDNLEIEKIDGFQIFREPLSGNFNSMCSSVDS